MKKSGIKLSSAYFWTLFMFVLLFVGAIFSVKAIGDIPEATVTYSSDNDWEGTLILNSDQTVKISGINHSNDGTDYYSAIKIYGNAVVNLVFEGENVLAGNSSRVSAGIEVEEGSTVNIYGLDGSSLTVTGGEDSAGIGGIGYGNGENPKAGNVNIHSGNIKAIGGKKGAGIGSGNHSSASDINIMGGNITAIGSGWAAGIGSGYGTSGGAQNPGVGFYNGGNITISGGIVRAAAYPIDFDRFDPYDTSTLYNADYYQNNCGAGIGGGYGASSGNIVINGKADVIAIGACGGAGIGSGRGTSKENQYDAEHFDVNITIGGNAKVIAMAADDTRGGNNTPEGGAGIGLGRGCTFDGQPKGVVKIEDNANVFAVGSYHAQAIGGSRTVGSDVHDAHLESIDVGSGTIVMAVSDGYRDAMDYDDGSNFANFLVLNFESDYFENRSDFFTEDKFPLRVEVIDADNLNSKTMFSIQQPSKLCIMVRVSGVNTYKFVIKDYQGENGEKIFLSNPMENNSSRFTSDPTKVKIYDSMGLTSRVDREGTINSEYGELKIKIEAKEGIFEYGSTFFCDGINDPAVIEDLNSKLDKKYADKLGKILYFDIGVKDRNDKNYIDLKGEKVKIYVEVPDGWNKDRVFALFVTPDGDETFEDTQKLEVIDGVTYLSFETDHFSSYALFDPIEEEEYEGEQEESYGEGENGEGGSLENDENENKNENEKSGLEKFLLTGDNSWYAVATLALLLIISLFMIRVLFYKPGKRYSKK